MRTCDEIQQDIAAGARLEEAEAAHAEHCETCGPLVVAAARARELLAEPSAPPLAGFVDRATAGGMARHRALRQRRRALGATGAVAACGLAAALLFTRGGEEAPVVEAPRAPAVGAPAVPAAAPAPAPPPRAEIDALLQPIARWDHVEEPLAAYRWLAEADSTGGENR